MSSNQYIVAHCCFLVTIVIGLLTINTQTVLSLEKENNFLQFYGKHERGGIQPNYISFGIMQEMFNSASSRLVFNLAMKNISNINSTLCLENDPCQNFGQLFQAMKSIIENNTQIIGTNNSVNILFMINIKSNLELDDYGDVNLPSNSLISYYFLFQSPKMSFLNFRNANSYLKLKERTDIAWILFNNLSIINFKIVTNVASTSFGYTNCMLDSCQLEHYSAEDSSSEMKKVNFIFENTKLNSATITSSDTYLTYFKGCRFFGSSFIEIRSCNQINFVDIFMEQASLNIPIYGANQVLFQNGNFKMGYFIVATIDVKSIYIQNVHVVECTKLTIVFSLFHSQYISIIDSSVKRSGGSLLIRSTLKVELVNVDFDGNYLGNLVSETLSSPISFNIVDQLYMINVTVQNHYGDSRPAFAIEILENSIIEIRECNFVNNKISAVSIHNQLIAASKRYSYTIYKSNFINNSCKTSGCGLNLDMLFNLQISECKFENNYSPYNGSAIFATKAFSFTMSNNNLKNNTADLFGGAIYLLGTSSIVSYIRNCVLYGNKAKKGGGLFIQYSPLKILNSDFIENKADYGGALYSFIPLNQSSIFYSCSFSNNQGFKYGPNFLAFAKKFYILDTVYKFIKPGESITVNITAQSYDSELVPLNSMPDFFQQRYYGKRIYLHVAQEYTSFIFTPYVVTQPEIDREYNITLDIANTPLLNMYVINCSSDEQLKPYALDSVANIYACEKIPVLSMTLLIAILIPSLVIVFGLGIVVSVCVMKGIFHIQKRLSLLRKKENAEKSVEKRIIDKTIIFGDSYEPLLDSEIQSYEYGQEMKVRSFIIPVSEITIEKKIAEGGQGVVYLGLWNNSSVAIKSLKSDQSEGFETEVSLLASLRHPFILTLYGISITNENKYMVTEFLEGGSLEKLIYSCKLREVTLSLTEKVNILKDIASGMNYLHTLNPPIIHRDLKPANVLLDKHNRCKIADFGLSLPLSQSNTTMTKNIGTFLYMSPETIQSETTTNHNTDKNQRVPKVDVFSFAIIMWELFFEVSPYCKSDKVNQQSDGSIVDVISKVLKGERPNIPFKSENELQEWLLLYPVHECQSKEHLHKRVLKYCELLRQCWQTNPMERPSFSQIIPLLNEISI